MDTFTVSQSEAVTIEYDITTGRLPTLLVYNSSTGASLQGTTTTHSTFETLTFGNLQAGNYDVYVNSTSVLSFDVGTMVLTAASAHVSPTVTGLDFSVAANSSIAASSIFTLSNPSGDTIGQYLFWDGGSGGGHFTVNGVTQAANQWIVVAANSLNTVKYVGGSSPGAESLYVEVFDATTGAYSSYSGLTATTTQAHIEPTVNVQNITVAAGQSVAGSSMISSITNPSGDLITQYVFYDSGSGGGHFVFNGVVQPANQWIYVDTSKLAQLQYVGGSSAGTETLSVAAYDYTNNTYTNFSSLTATTTAPVAQSGFHIHLIADDSVASAPAGFAAAIQQAATLIENTLKDNITVNLRYGWGTFNNQASSDLSGTRVAEGNFLAGDSMDYSTAKQALTLHANKSGGDSVAALSSLPATNSSMFLVSSAQEKAFGIWGGSTDVLDGAIGFGTGWGTDWVGGALHELTHALGRTNGVYTSGLFGLLEKTSDFDGSYNPTILDLYRFNGSGRHVYVGGGTDQYFSIDNGATRLAYFGSSSDTGDLYNNSKDSSDPHNLSVGDPYNETVGGNALTNLDVQILNAIGFASTVGSTTSGSTINNSSANATVVGTAGDDTINATGGNATITAGAGNDRITGGSGTNTSVYSGASKNYAVTVAAGSSNFTVQDKVGSDGTDTLTSIQHLKFTDLTIDANSALKTAALPSAQLTELVDLYVAYFNRAPDSTGLDFWGGQLSDGASFNAIAQGFTGSAEASALYPSSLSTSAFVTAVYNNVLGRAPDSGGLNYWVSQLQTGASTRNNYVLNVIETVLHQNGTSDAQYIANKYSVGAHFALAQGLNDSGWARTVMSGVNGTASSVSSADAQTDAFATTAATTSGSELTIKILGIVA